MRGMKMRWEVSTSCHRLVWVLKCKGMGHVLPTVLMAYPNQASSLQGSRGVSCGLLAAHYLGTGSGWQQSKQNWVLLAVVGECARTGRSYLCPAELAQLCLICFPTRELADVLGAVDIPDARTAVPAGPRQSVFGT